MLFFIIPMKRIIKLELIINTHMKLMYFVRTAKLLVLFVGIQSKVQAYKNI